MGPKHALPPALGMSSDGGVVRWNPHQHHTLVVGPTGSGKSVASYVMLAGAALDPLVRVVGVDPSHLLLHPFSADGTSRDTVLGTGNMVAAAELLERLVRLMEGRLAQLLSEGDDQWLASPAQPTVLVVLEELAGLYTAADADDALHKHVPKVKARIVNAVGRLLREARKVGFCVLTLVQRPDAAVLGGAERGQYTRRIAMGADNADAIRMVFEDLPDDLSQLLLRSPAGVGIIAEPGLAPKAFRAGYMDYDHYRAFVRQHYLTPRTAFDALDGASDV